MCDIIKYTNRCIRKYQQKGEKRTEKISKELITENFPNLMKITNNPHLQEVQQTPCSITAKRYTLKILQIKKKS